VADPVTMTIPLLSGRIKFLEAQLRETTNALHAACMVITDDTARAIALSIVKDSRRALASAEQRG